MTFDTRLFFENLAEHLTQRADTVRSLAVMAACERWVQMEAASLLDTNRDRYGLGGGDERQPSWWVTCEHRTVDVWAGASAGGGLSIELKALHNNKNFYGRVASLRSDLMPERKRLDWSNGFVERAGICIVTYVRYGSDSQYVHLRSSRGGPVMNRDEFLSELHDAFRDEHASYAGATPVTLTALREITSLEQARYVEAGNGSAVWLGLVGA